MPVLMPQALVTERVAAIHKYHKDTGVPKAEIDLSGGVDSAVIAGLLVRAIGSENVIAVHSGINSNYEALARAQEVANAFSLKLCVIDLTDIYDNLLEAMQFSMMRAGFDSEETLRRLTTDPTIKGSIRSTLRAPVGRGFNRMFGGGIRHGTGNECEDRWTRFYQKGGDGEVDTNPIAMLSKAETYQLALKLGVPKSVILARPSPDLWGTGDDHNDEDEYAAYFGFSATSFGQTFYGYIDAETGEYTRVGLIERVSRLLDECGETLFGDTGEQTADHLGGMNTAAFGGSGLSSDQVRQVLLAARRIENMTRHKLNPNCPSLGSRSGLIEAGIITNTLPVL
jgi:NAD+ synthetase